MRHARRFTASDLFFIGGWIEACPLIFVCVLDAVEIAL
jgi:hypothetical protein